MEDGWVDDVWMDRWMDGWTDGRGRISPLLHHRSVFPLRTLVCLHILTPPFHELMWSTLWPHLRVPREGERLSAGENQHPTGLEQECSWHCAGWVGRDCCQLCEGEFTDHLLHLGLLDMDLFPKALGVSPLCPSGTLVPSMSLPLNICSWRKFSISFSAPSSQPTPGWDLVRPWQASAALLAYSIVHLSLESNCLFPLLSSWTRSL